MKIKENVYSIGVLNPNLRIFDIIMETDYGTSYNAYLVKGEKGALIETVHARFFDEYLENIQEVCDLKDIEYVIMNHTEPDHSGSLTKLLELAPHLKIVATGAAHKYLTAIMNTDYQKIVVKDGDTIDLGGYTLVFKPAPFLHWPDSMFTYVPENKTLFSCDMFGCHYCEPRVLDSRMYYPENYDKSFRYYFGAIFSPFKKFVLDGIEKIKDFDFDMVCPSHGPVLTERINDAISKYKEWSIEKPNDVKIATVIFASAYRYTEQIAKAIAKTLEDKGMNVHIFDVNVDRLCEIAEFIEKSDVLFIGSPTINKDAVKPIWDVMAVIDVYKNKGKTCGIFGSYGWSGEAVPMLVARAKGLGLNVLEEGLRINFKPSEEELAKAVAYANLA